MCLSIVCNFKIIYTIAVVIFLFLWYTKQKWVILSV